MDSAIPAVAISVEDKLKGAITHYDKPAIDPRTAAFLAQIDATNATVNKTQTAL